MGSHGSGYRHISTGDILRAAKKAGTELGNEAASYMDAGQLVPDDLVIRLVEEKLKDPDTVEHGWLLDGFPRTKAQAEALDNLNIKPNKMILLNVPEEVLVERITGRRMDKETKEIYHMKFNPPPEDIPEDRIVQRSDDTEEALKTRLVAYNENIELIRDFYGDSLPVDEIDADQEPEVVYSEVAHSLLY